MKQKTKDGLGYLAGVVVAILLWPNAAGLLIWGGALTGILYLLLGQRAWHWVKYNLAL